MFLAADWLKLYQLESSGKGHPYRIGHEAPQIVIHIVCAIRDFLDSRAIQNPGFRNPGRKPGLLRHVIRSLDEIAGWL